jgi:hypothetical protein
MVWAAIFSITMRRRFGDRCGAANNYTFSSLILGVVKSTPFQMRESAMTFITRKSLPRRTFLRGVGALLCRCWI